MKKLLTLILLLTSLQVFAQVPMSSYTIYTGNSDSSKFLTSVNGATRNVYGIDITKRSVKYTDTAAMFAGYLRVGRFTDSIAALRAYANTKLNISDTVNMRVRLNAGANVNITGTFPNLTISGAGGASGSAILYSTTGSNTDGAMTQAATTTALNSKLSATPALSNTTASYKIADSTKLAGLSTETGAAIKTKLEALTGTSRLDASAIQNLPSGGSAYSQSISFTASIPFTYPATVMNQTISAPITFTPNTIGAVAGNGAIVRLVADGVNEPVFSGFQIFQGNAFDNTAGMVNIVNFLFNGTEYNYTINQAQIIDTTPPTVVSKGTASTTTIQFVFSESVSVTTAGWSFKKNGSALTLTSVSGSGTTWTFIVGSMASGDVLTYSYNPTTGNTVDQAGNEIASVTDATVTNNITNGLSFVEDFTAADGTEISGRTVAGGAAAWTPDTGFNTGGMYITGNAVRGQSNTTHERYYVNCLTANVDIKATISAVGADYPLLIFRYADANNYFAVNLNDCSVDVNVGGSHTYPYAGSGATASGDYIRVVANGTSVSIYRNTTLLTTLTVSSSLTSGNHGIYFHGDATTAITTYEVTAL